MFESMTSQEFLFSTTESKQIKQEAIIWCVEHVTNYVIM